MIRVTVVSARRPAGFGVPSHFSPCRRGKGPFHLGFMAAEAVRHEYKHTLVRRPAGCAAPFRRAPGTAGRGISLGIRGIRSSYYAKNTKKQKVQQYSGSLPHEY